jgi:SAM-dependent methyltransferase
MEQKPYYQPDLAWVHHTGYSHHVAQVRDGIVKLLRGHGLTVGARVLDVGCGSGLLARALIAEGFAVHGVDASAAMIELARNHAEGGRFDVVRLPTRRAVDDVGALPAADAVVSTGHVLNYLDSRDDIAQALGELARAVRPGGLIALDLMTERFCEARDRNPLHAQVTEDWAIVTRFSRPQPFRFDRAITVFRRAGDAWRRSDEHHRNVTFEADAALRVLRDHGLDARAQAAFGDEALPDGLIVLVGARR